jgi:hypothetical protein
MYWRKAFLQAYVGHMLPYQKVGMFLSPHFTTVITDDARTENRRPEN